MYNDGLFEIAVRVILKKDYSIDYTQCVFQKIMADIGRHLALKSEQDEDEYKRSQINVSGA